MKTYKLIRIYETPADSKAMAWTIFRDMEASGNLTELLGAEFVKEKDEPGLFNQFKKQLKG